MKVLLIATVFLAFGCGPMIGNISHKQALALYSAKTSENYQTLDTAAGIIDGQCRVAMELANTRDEAKAALKRCARMMSELAERSALIEKQPPKYTEDEVKGRIALMMFVGNADDMDLDKLFKTLTQNLRRWTAPYNIAVDCLSNTKSDPELTECLQKINRASFMWLPAEMEKIFDAGSQVIAYCAEQMKKYDQYQNKDDFVKTMGKCAAFTNTTVEKSKSLVARYRNPIYRGNIMRFLNLTYLGIIYFTTSAQCATEGAKNRDALFTCVDVKAQAITKEIESKSKQK